MTRTESGLLYNCFRASCTAKGIVASDSSLKKGPRKTKPRPVFTAKTTPLSDKVCSWLYQAYQIDRDLAEENQILYCPKESRIAIPSFTHLGIKWGTTAKLCPWGTSKKKALFFPSQEYPPGLSFHKKSSGADTLVVVEDSLSAIKVSTMAHGVAMLGVNINDAAALLLKSLCKDYGISRVLFMFDPDATQSAARFQRRYKAILPITVVPMKEDPKDTDREELYGLIYGK